MNEIGRTLAIGVACRLFGPFVLAPGLLAAFAMSLALTESAFKRALYTIITSLGVAVPLALELLGVLAPSYSYDGTSMMTHPHITLLPETLTVAFLATATFGGVVAPVLYAGVLRGRLTDAEKAMLTQSWQLRQLARGADRSDPRGLRGSAARGAAETTAPSEADIL